MSKVSDRRRMKVICGGIVAAGAAAVVAGGALLLTPSSGSQVKAAPGAAGVAKGQNAAFDDSGDDCGAIHDAITNHRQFDGDAAERCEASEDAQFKDENGLHSQVGETCQLVLKRAVTGDLDMPVAILTWCRTVEVETSLHNNPNGNGEPDSVCTGAQIALEKGEKIDSHLGIICFHNPSPTPSAQPTQPAVQATAG